MNPKTVFLFPGQGSQFAGMGKALAAEFPSAQRVFDEANDALGFNLARLCCEGPEQDLKLTANTQPALLTISTAAFRILEERGWQPDFVAGHSLGEYSALVAAGSLDFADAVRLVRKRGEYMQSAVPPGVGAMAALLKLPEGKLDEVLAQAARRRSGERRQSQFAGSGGHCGTRRSGQSRDRPGEGRGRAPRGAACR